jgi:CarD family transcriptional regulator
VASKPVVSKVEPAARPVAAAPVKSAEKPSPAKPAAPAAVAPAPAAVKAPVDAKPAPVAARPGPAIIAKPRAAAPKNGFKLNEFIVYPAHGVGQITSVEIQEVAGFSLELYVVSFIKDKMILKVPTSKVATVGMRKLAETNIVDKALTTLSGRARIKRTMWSRRAQEYEAKINSGDLVTIAEVVRDLYRSDTQPEQSYSERQLYEAALDRMAREIAAVRRLIDSESLKLIESFLQKGPKRGQKTEADGETEASSDVDDATDDVDAAA